jgi:hypothetical protein
MTAVLGIFMSEGDAPTAVVDATGTYHDATICDFAWKIAKNSSSTPAEAVNFQHDAAAGNVTWYHFAMMMHEATDGNDGGELHKFFDVNGLVIGYIHMALGEMGITAETSAGSDASTTFSVPLTLKRYDVKIDITTTMAIDIYEEGGGSPIRSASIALGTSAKPGQMSLTQYDNFRDLYTSEVYMADYDTRNTRPVKQKVNATGNYSAWTGGFAEVSDGDVSTAASGAAGADKLSMNLITYPGPASPTGIKEVVVKMMASKGASGPANIRAMCRISSTDYFSGNLSPVQGVPQNVYATFALNPNTSAAWATADLDTTEFGVEAVT